MITTSPKTIEELLRKKRSSQIHFEFVSYEKQITDEIFRARKSWIEDLTPEQKDDPNEQPYALLVKIELYNKIREIFCRSTMPIDTPEIFGLIIGILDESKWRPFYLVNKGYYDETLKENKNEDKKE